MSLILSTVEAKHGTPQAHGCLYCKWAYLDNIERAQIRLSRKAPHATECLHPNPRAAATKNLITSVSFFTPCSGFKPCPTQKNKGNSGAYTANMQILHQNKESKSD